MSSVALLGGAAAADDDDIDGVPLLPLELASTWLQSIPPPPLSAFVPASQPTIPAINPVKAALFASGVAPVLSVNRVEQERAAAEDKKRRQEEEAKAVYQDFVASFAVEPQQQPAQSKPKHAKSPFTAFVRGGTIGGDNTSTTSHTPSKRTEPHPPASVTSSTFAAVEPPWKRQRPTSPLPPTPEPLFSPPAAPAARGKQRNIDLFMAELQQRQAEPQVVRDEVQSAGSATTNVFIAGLPLSTTESDLADEMVRFGDIASVKLLYPRTEEERARTTMNGFVAYMLRRDAEDSLREMNNTLWRGHQLKLHWSKPITLPPTPAATKANKQAGNANATSQFVVQLPADPSRRSLIDQLALQVSQHGVDYEQSILEQHAPPHPTRTQQHQPANHPPYAFLFAIDSPDNIYYRWRVYSLRSGGGLERWDTRPFQMIPHGPMWLPPVDGANVRVVEEVRRVGSEESGVAVGMTSGEADELQRMLSSLTLQRASILAAMGWCLERAVAAAFIVRSICAALLSSSTDSCRRVSIVYLLSDLLYNSSAPVRNASLFRREATQPDTLHIVWAAFSPQTQLNGSKRQKSNSDDEQPSASAALDAEDGQQQRHRVGRKERELVLSVLRTWQTWSLFESDKIEQWMMSVRGLQPTAINSATATQPAAALPATGTGAADDDIDGIPLTVSSL